ncbi:terminal uridylyltransferase Tailor-like [Chironomus tepperi]|uniref:terminal uridylyltransferase Tailor-like n=1 Tax=Chironomus tepperi TaxID=113505 RepID=UPI00391F7206
MDKDTSINHHDAYNEKEKLFMMTLDTYVFTKRIMQHKENNNKINKQFATILYDAMNEIESFIQNAEIDDSDDEVYNIKNVIPSIDSSVLQPHHYYYCKACNQSVKSSNKAMNEHFYSPKHLKNLRILSAKMENGNQKSRNRADNSSTSLDKTLDGSTHSLSSIDDHPPSKTPTKKERVNSLPARVRDILPKDNMPKKMREFLVKYDIENFAIGLVKEGQAVQNSQKHVRVCDMLRRRLIGRYPNVKIHPFGSFINGLGHEKTDLDIFIDTENCFYGKLSKRKMKDAIFQTQRILSNCQEQWSDFEPIVKARTPILRVFCSVEKIDCDLSFSNGLSTANTALISYLIGLQPILKKLVLFIKFWAMRLNLGTNSYLLTLMVIFYLQQESILPPISVLQDAVPPTYIEGWNTAFATPNLAQLKLQFATDFRHYLTGFFKYYGYSFDFTNHIICILTGHKVPKHIFDHGKEQQLPPVFRPFANYMSKINLEEADEVEDLFANYKPLVIQDPFDLVHNVSKGIQEQKLMKIIHYMRTTYDLLTNAKA